MYVAHSSTMHIQRKIFLNSAFFPKMLSSFRVFAENARNDLKMFSSVSKTTLSFSLRFSYSAQLCYVLSAITEGDQNFRISGRNKHI
jgi:hypothetical protein